MNIMKNLEVLDFLVEKCNEGYKVKMYMINAVPLKEFYGISISLIFKHSLVRFNEL